MPLSEAQRLIRVPDDADTVRHFVEVMRRSGVFDDFTARYQSFRRSSLTDFSNRERVELASKGLYLNYLITCNGCGVTILYNTEKDMDMIKRAHAGSDCVYQNM